MLRPHLRHHSRSSRGLQRQASQATALDGPLCSCCQNVSLKRKSIQALLASALPGSIACLTMRGWLSLWRIRRKSGSEHLRVAALGRRVPVRRRHQPALRPDIACHLYSHRLWCAKRPTDQRTECHCRAWDCGLSAIIVRAADGGAQLHRVREHARMHAHPSGTSHEAAASQRHPGLNLSASSNTIGFWGVGPFCRRLAGLAIRNLHLNVSRAVRA